MNRIPGWLVGLSAVGGIAGCIAISRNSWTRYEGEEKLHGRTVVITGANSGIGKETALQLATRGAGVVMGCRDLEKCEEARKEIIEMSLNQRVKCAKLDLASIKSIEEFAKTLTESENRVDILINNAAVMACPKELTEDGFERQLGVNYLGHFLLTHLLLDKLKKSTPSRIINVTCTAHLRGRINFRDLNSDERYNGEKVYAMTKLANILHTKELAEHLKGTDVTVVSANPGLCKTDLGRHLAMNRFLLSRWLLAPLWFVVMGTPQQTVHTVLMCALDPTIKPGAYYQDCVEASPTLDTSNDVTSNKLWHVAMKWMRLSS